MSLIDVPPVHAVTDSRILAAPGFVQKAVAVLDALGRRGAVHLRGRGLTASQLLSFAAQLQASQGVNGGRIVINDRPDVALAANAWGVQLGQRSLLTDDARRVTANCRIGVSVHSLKEAEAAHVAGADWLLAGHVYATPSHADVPPRGSALVTELSRLGTPVVAIGGVRPEDVPALRAAGAHGVAAIRGIWDAANPADAARAYLQGHE